MKTGLARHVASVGLPAMAVVVLMGVWSLEAVALPHSGFNDPGFPPVHPNPDIAYYGQAIQAEYLPGAFVYGVKISNFTNVNRTAVGPDEQQMFDAILDATVDIPGFGIVGLPISLAGPVTTVLHNYAYGDAGTFDAEIVSMTLTGPAGPIPVVVRENPDLPSLGQTSISDLGGGLYEIDSFFDVFTELSINGGQTFYPDVNGPGHMELCPEPATMVVLALGALAMLRRRK